MERLRAGWLEQRGEAGGDEIERRSTEIEQQAAQLAGDAAALEQERVTRLRG